MKRWLCGIGALTFGAALAWAQSEARLITRPALPSREVIERLSLELAWRNQIKFQNGRDGFFSVQIIPSKSGPEILVLTLAGAVILIDAENGDVKWRMPLEGKVLAEAGANNQSIFVTRGPQLYVLNRRTGMHRVYSTLEGFPDPVMGFRLPATPSAPLLADDAGLFVAMGQRVTAYVHPDFEKALEATRKDVEKRFEATNPDPSQEKPPLELEKLKAAELERLKAAVDKTRADAYKPSIEITKGTSLQPYELWNYYTTGASITQAPLATYNQVNVVTNAGNFLALNRFESFLRFEFRTQGSVSAPMGQYGTTAYVGSDDYSLYALDMHSEKIIWRFVAQSPIYRKLRVTDRDIFVTADRLGMVRLVRETGEQVWRNDRAEQFLSAGNKFVYARDAKGYLLILDALRGTTLAAWDARDWTMGVSNEWTDRFYLAAQDGQLIGLRHRDSLTPLKNRTLLNLRGEDPNKVAEPKKEEGEKKEPEKKEPEKKEEKKDEKKEEKKDEKKDEKKELKKDEKKDDKKADKKDDKKDVKKDEKKDDKKADDKKDEKKDEKKAAWLYRSLTPDRTPVVARWEPREATLAADAWRRERESWLLH